MKKTVFAVALLLVLVSFMDVAAWAGTAMERVAKAGELVVGTSGAQPPMTAITVGLDADIAREEWLLPGRLHSNPAVCRSAAGSGGRAGGYDGHVH